MAKGRKTGGRRKGSGNKLPGELRQMITDALCAVGGVEYLKEQAAKNPAPFMNLVSKVLPKDVNVNATGGLTLSITLSKPQ
jgi:hypothetical protein